MQFGKDNGDVACEKAGLAVPTLQEYGCLPFDDPQGARGCAEGCDRFSFIIVGLPLLNDRHPVDQQVTQIL